MNHSDTFVKAHNSSSSHVLVHNSIITWGLEKESYTILNSICFHLLPPSYFLFFPYFSITLKINMISESWTQDVVGDCSSADRLCWCQCLFNWCQQPYRHVGSIWRKKYNIRCIFTSSDHFWRFEDFYYVKHIVFRTTISLRRKDILAFTCGTKVLSHIM